MTQTKYIRQGLYNGVPCTEVVHWCDKVIAVFPEITPEELFAHPKQVGERLNIIEAIYSREGDELLKNGAN